MPPGRIGCLPVAPRVSRRGRASRGSSRRSDRASCTSGLACVQMIERRGPVFGLLLFRREISRPDDDPPGLVCAARRVMVGVGLGDSRRAPRAGEHRVDGSEDLRHRAEGEVQLDVPA